MNARRRSSCDVLDVASTDASSLLLPRMEAEVRVYTVGTFYRIAVICYGFSGVNDVSVHRNGEQSLAITS